MAQKEQFYGFHIQRRNVGKLEQLITAMNVVQPKIVQSHQLTFPHLSTMRMVMDLITLTPKEKLLLRMEGSLQRVSAAARHCHELCASAAQAFQGESELLERHLKKVQDALEESLH